MKKEGEYAVKRAAGVCALIGFAVLLGLLSACAKDPAAMAGQVLTQAEKQYYTVFNRKVEINNESVYHWDAAEGRLVGGHTEDDEDFCAVTDGSPFTSREEMAAYLSRSCSQALCRDRILPALFDCGSGAPLYREQDGVLYVNCDRGYLGEYSIGWDFATASVTAQDDRHMTLRIRDTGADEWAKLRFVCEDKTWKLDSCPFDI